MPRALKVIPALKALKAIPVLKARREAAYPDWRLSVRQATSVAVTFRPKLWLARQGKS